jgi:protein-tyrosine phosphatase
MDYRTILLTIGDEQSSLPDVTNLRDLGGIAIDGGVIRPGRLLRSAAPAHFGAAARLQVEAAAPLAIVDLRSIAERDATPTVLPPDARRVVPGDDGGHAGDPAGFAAACTRSAAETCAEIHRIYAALPLAHEAAFGAFFRALAGGDVPLLVHCAVGKDRTGAAVAILLAALGATAAAIEADYLASNDSHADIAAAFAADPLTAAIRAAPTEVWAPMLHADAGYLATLFAALRAFGGARHYVARAVGEEGVQRIGAHLLAP